MLFKTSQDVTKYAAISGTPNFIALKPTIKMVERDHLVKLLGLELYNDLNNAYSLITNETSLSQAHQLLLEACREVIGPYLCYYHVPKSEINVTDSGNRRSETDKEKTAFQYQITNYREANLREAEKASEMLLQFLESNKSSYPLWVNSTAFKAYKSLIITTAQEFDDNYKTASPYRNYWAMRWKMVDVEELHIRQKLGDALFESLKAKNANPNYTFTTKEAALLVMLKKAIAYYTIAFALPDMSVRLDEDGLTIMGTVRTSNDRDNRQNATDNQFSHIANNAESAAREWMEKALAYLLKNATDFPLFELPKKAECVEEPGNDQLTASFGLF